MLIERRTRLPPIGRPARCCLEHPEGRAWRPALWVRFSFLQTPCVGVAPFCGLRPECSGPRRAVSWRGRTRGQDRVLLLPRDTPAPTRQSTCGERASTPLRLTEQRGG